MSIVAVKTSGYPIPISREMAIDAGLIQPTPEEHAERERRAAEYRRRAAEDAAKLEAARTVLAELTDPLARAVLDLHAEDEHGECAGCDYSGYEAESPDWPCRTVDVVAARFGVELGG